MVDEKGTPCNIEIKAVDFPIESRMAGLPISSEINQKVSSPKEEIQTSNTKSMTGYSHPLPANFEFEEKDAREPLFHARTQRFANHCSNEILVPMAVLPSKRYEETKSIQSIIESSKALETDSIPKRFAVHMTKADNTKTLLKKYIEKGEQKIIGCEEDLEIKSQIQQEYRKIDQKKKGRCPSVVEQIEELSKSRDQKVGSKLVPREGRSKEIVDASSTWERAQNLQSFRSRSLKVVRKKEPLNLKINDVARIAFMN